MGGPPRRRKRPSCPSSSSSRSSNRPATSTRVRVEITPRHAPERRQADIAALAGVARENASRAINGLLRQGLLAREKSSFYVVRNPAGLRELAEL